MARKIFNREISWLAFNHRVLQEAADPNVPLLERIKFLGIFSNNLDEFFKVRVATIKRMIDVQEKNQTVEGERPRKVLAQIQKKVIELQSEFEDTFRKILKELEKENIYLINENGLNEEQAKYVRTYFEDKVLPALSPVMLFNVEEFPALRDKSIYLAVRLSHSGKKLPPEYALIELPTAVISRFLVLPKEQDRTYIILLDDVIRFCLNDVFAIFPYDTFEAYTIKLTRDAELDYDNDLSQSFLEKIAQGLSNRKSGQPVRFVYDGSMPPEMFNYLIQRMGLDVDDNLIPGGRYHNFKDFMNFPDLGKKHLLYPPAPPAEHPLMRTPGSILAIMKQQDFLLHCPYQKFSHFINLLREAAIDPDVTSIKITLYRLGQNSKVIQALLNAARNGKDVTAILELQARFDEKNNIYYAKKLEEAGVNVIFGLKGLKVHAKLVLITRRENKQNVQYACVGTGNFHEGNATVYTDLLLFTCDKRITSEVERVFSIFNEPYHNYTFRYLLVSPLSMRQRITRLIDNEIKNALAGKEAYIDIKINHLVDRGMVNKLMQAQEAGVKIRLIVRGICSIYTGHASGKPIDAISIVDKYLEHARFFFFCNGGKELCYISSADWMTRNLDHRIEVASPVFSPELKEEIRKIFEIQWSDNVKARIINDQQNNPYRPHTHPPVRAQLVIYDFYQQLQEIPVNRKPAPSLEKATVTHLSRA
jgi:polyphosphate kinase